MLPVVVSFLVPTLIKIAESVFAKSSEGTPTGPIKKQFVLEFLGKIFDKLQSAGKLPDFPTVDEKQIFLEIMDTLIEHLVPALTRK